VCRRGTFSFQEVTVHKHHQIFEMRLGSSSDESDEEPNQNRSKSNQRSLQQSFSASRSNPKYKSQSQSSSPPPDPQISTFLANQRLNNSSETEAEKAARLARFSGSAAPKSRYQREKEEAERKKREEEKEAANAYTAFLQDMERPREDGRGTGSKKSGYQDKGNCRAMGFVSAGGESQVFILEWKRLHRMLGGKSKRVV